MKNRHFHRRLKQILALFTSLLTLFGCTQLPHDETNVQWQQHQERLTDITDYQASGKLGFISPDERRSMKFYWQQHASVSQLRLTSVFGQTLLKMDMDPNGTKIETYDDHTYQSADGEQLLYHLTGLTIPLEQLTEWLKGSAANADNYTLLPTHTLANQSKTLNNKTWLINYKSYVDVPETKGSIPLPNSLVLTQDQIKINLLISNWKIK